jgi:hypothetical protein
MLVIQRDNEIGILLNYLNKKKEGGAVGPGDMPVQRGPSASNGFADPNSSSAKKSEEQKQNTLF